MVGTATPSPQAKPDKKSSRNDDGPDVEPESDEDDYDVENLDRSEGDTDLWENIEASLSKEGESQEEQDYDVEGPEPDVKDPEPDVEDPEPSEENYDVEVPERSEEDYDVEDGKSGEDEYDIAEPTEEDVGGYIETPVGRVAFWYSQPSSRHYEEFGIHQGGRAPQPRVRSGEITIPRGRVFNVSGGRELQWVLSMENLRELKHEVEDAIEEDVQLDSDLLYSWMDEASNAGQRGEELLYPTIKTYYDGLPEDELTVEDAHNLYVLWDYADRTRDYDWGQEIEGQLEMYFSDVEMPKETVEWFIEGYPDEITLEEARKNITKLADVLRDADEETFENDPETRRSIISEISKKYLYQIQSRLPVHI